MHTKQQKRRRIQENREYRKRNPSKVKLWQREYYQRHKERITAQNRDHYAHNRERILDSQRKYKSKKLNKSIKQRIRLTPEERKNRLLVTRRKRYYENREAQIARVHRRRKNLGFNQLNKPFPNCAWHHITDNDVVAIPKRVHSTFSAPSREKHRQLVLDYYGSLENMIKQTLAGLTVADKPLQRTLDGVVSPVGGETENP